MIIGYSSSNQYSPYSVTNIFPILFFVAPYSGDLEDPYPSLSDYHDYEPNLEFDDSDLRQQLPEHDDGEKFFWGGWGYSEQE